MSLGEEHSQSAHEQRYWLSVGDGQTYGPYSVAELNAYAADGRVTASSQLCADGSNVWISASSVLTEVEFALPSPPQAETFAAQVEGARTIRLTWAIVATVVSVPLCCLPIGVGAIVYAMKANSRYAVGDVHGGRADEGTYRTWLWATFVLCAINAVGSVWSCFRLYDAFSSLRL